MLKLNNSEHYESLGNFHLSKEKYPIAYNAKVEELMEECDMKRKDAEFAVDDMEFELEIYYEKGIGLFAVETEAVDSHATIYSPYTKEELEPFDED